VVAPDVPKMLDALFVPNNWAGVAFGKPKSNAGNCINPPPPPIASTQPAVNAASIRKIITIKSGI
jgi:hypothetical protein